MRILIVALTLLFSYQGFALDDDPRLGEKGAGETPDSINSNLGNLRKDLISIRLIKCPGTKHQYRESLSDCPDFQPKFLPKYVDRKKVEDWRLNINEGEKEKITVKLYKCENGEYVENVSKCPRSKMRIDLEKLKSLNAEDNKSPIKGELVKLYKCDNGKYVENISECPKLHLEFGDSKKIVNSEKETKGCPDGVLSGDVITCGDGAKFRLGEMSKRMEDFRKLLDHFDDSCYYSKVSNCVPQNLRKVSKGRDLGITGCPQATMNGFGKGRYIECRDGRRYFETNFEDFFVTEEKKRGPAPASISDSGVESSEGATGSSIDSGR